MGNRTKEARSANMAHIPSKGTKPEETVRKYLFAHGFRYRKNMHNLPGQPDIVLSKYKTVIFVNGCFCHAHEGCKWFANPKSRTEFWIKKFACNTSRDMRNYAMLREAGWEVLLV